MISTRPWKRNSATLDKRVFLISTAGGPVPPKKGGGAIREYVYQLAYHLPRVGIKAIAVAVKCSPEDLSLKELGTARIIQINTARVPANLPWRLHHLAYILKEYLWGAPIARMLKENDIIHVNTPYVGCYIANTKFARKMVYTCHIDIWSSDYVDHFTRINRKFETFVMRNSKAIIAVSSSLRRLIISKVRLPEDKVFYIPNGVDSDFFRPDVPYEDVKRSYGLEGYKVLLYVGRIVYYKGLDVLIRAVDLLVNKYGMKDVKCMVVGSLKIGKGENYFAMEMMKLVKSLGLTNNVLFTGEKDPSYVRKIYAAADVVVVPSRLEAFGMVITEAMATGKPVVGANVGSLPELIQHGTTGYLFPSGDYKVLARTLASLLSDESLCKKFGIMARSITEKRYTWEGVAREVAAMYTDVFGEPAKF